MHTQKLMCLFLDRDDTIQRFLIASERHGWRNLLSKWGGGTSARQKHYRKVLWFHLASVTSQTLEHDVITYAPCESLNYTILDKIIPLSKPVGEPAEIQIGCYRDDPGQSVTRAHQTISSDRIKPFDACVTEISICFHSGWHYRCSVTLVT